MDHFEDEQPEEDLETEETGSDELLSDDNLRLPENASTLVRLHAVRAWLTRRREVASSELGEAALTLQQVQQEQVDEARPRRRMRQEQDDVRQRTQLALNEAQQRLAAYEEAQELLEECVAHTTSGERVLVEYYLTLEEVIQTGEQQQRTSAWLRAFFDVQNRVEHVGAPQDYDA